MRSSIFAVVLFVGSSVVFAQNSDDIEPKIIEVRGSSSIEVAPDILYITFTLEDRTIDKKYYSLDSMEQCLVKLVEKHEIALHELQIKTTSTSLDNYSIKAGRYHKVTTYELKIEDLNVLVSLLNGLRALQVKDIKIDHTDHSKIEQYRQQTKIDAIQAAKQKASELLSAIDEHLGAAVNIVEIPTTRYTEHHSDNKYYGTIAKIPVLGEPYGVSFYAITLRSEVMARFAIE